MNVSKKEDYTVIEMPNFIAEDMAEKLNEDLTEIVNSDETKEFVLDVGNVTNIFSSGLRFITHLIKATEEAKRKLAVVNANESVRRVLDTANFEKVVPVFSEMLDFEIDREAVDGAESK